MFILHMNDGGAGVLSKLCGSLVLQDDRYGNSYKIYPYYCIQYILSLLVCVIVVNAQQQ